MERSDVASAAKPMTDQPETHPKLVVLESTTYPGTTDTELREVLEAGSGLKAGEGFHLAYSPEREDPGRKDHSVKTIPIDPFYLTWKAREYEQHTRFIELAGEINTKMPDYVVDRVAEALNADGKAVKGSRILILGLAYKPNVDDDRESPSYVLMKKLEQRGATVEYNDPHVPEIKHTREHPEYAGRQSVTISDEYDCLLLATNHAEYYDYDFSLLACPVVDTRNCLSKRPVKYFKA